MEACGGAHHWARTLAALGHTVTLLPPRAVRPFVRKPQLSGHCTQTVSTVHATTPNPNAPNLSDSPQKC
ncbi:transposase IS116/IS110/IS902 family protein [mine drainage metagenome]|uniref:Transposase IS116/IS110/IS902 family protein n=2 Tax=mine drainage metagenome TaxID=410659 RepID=T1D306_9ZZZZ